MPLRKSSPKKQPRAVKAADDAGAPMTPDQIMYLKELSQRAGDPEAFDETISRGEARKRIAALAGSSGARGAQRHDASAANLKSSQQTDTTGTGTRRCEQMRRTIPVTVHPEQECSNSVAKLERSGRPDQANEQRRRIEHGGQERPWNDGFPIRRHHLRGHRHRLPGGARSRGGPPSPRRHGHRAATGIPVQPLVRERARVHA